MRDLTKREKTYLTNINTETEKMALGPLVQSLIDVVNDGVEGVPGPAGATGATGPAGPAGPSVVEAGTPVNAISATATLLIDGDVVHGEMVSITNAGTDVYEFVSDLALSVTAPGNTPVDINAVSNKAIVDLTVDVNPTLGDTMTLGEKVYTFVPPATANGDGDIGVETLLADTQINIVNAILGLDDHNLPHPLVSCGEVFDADVLEVEALIGGTSGNTIVSEETFTAGTNIFTTAFLQNGTDCGIDDAVTALVAAITESDTVGVGATDATGGEVLLTADLGGVVGNDILVSATMVNGAFVDEAIQLEGGVDGTPGFAGQELMDDTYLYLCIADSDETGKSWRRLTLGAF